MYMKNGNMEGECLSGANEDFIFSYFGRRTALCNSANLLLIKFTGWLIPPITSPIF